MLYDLIRETSKRTGLDTVTARQALGILFSTAERQGAPMIKPVFDHVPGARLLSQSTGMKMGASSNPIAQLIEQTPGGRQHVSMSMFTKFHEIGLGHKEVAEVLASVGKYMEKTHKIYGIGHLGDLIVTSNDSAEMEHSAVA